MYSNAYIGSRGSGVSALKDILIALVIALIGGSILNGMNQSSGLGGSSASSNSLNGSPTTSADILSNTVSVDETNFESEVIESENPVLVDFYSDTCAPCKRMEPILGELAMEYQGSLKVVRIDVLRAPHLAQKYQISAIPVFMVFKEGKCEETNTGAMEKTKLVSMFKPLLQPVETKQ